MHNNIMAVGSRDRPPMLATGRYAQWQSCFLRYIDTRSNGEALRKCILEDSHEMWIAIERLKQGESLNIQDVKTNLFWEFGIFTSHDGESMESYYSRFYKMMNEMIRNNLTVATMQVNGKEIAKPTTPPYESAYEKDSDPEQAQRDKDMQKNLALIAKYFKKIYKPTNNNLRTSTNSRNKNVDTSPRYKNDNQTGQFGNQRTVIVVGARETEYRKPKRVKDYTYLKEKMLLCKQAENGVPLQAKQDDWLANTNEEIDEQELEAHYGFMARIQEVLPPKSDSIAESLEQVNSNVIPDSSDMCDNDTQTDQNAKDERVTPPNWVVTELCPGVLLHKYIAQDMREQPLNESFEK
ncbi:hypothetical protein Tco_0007261 [Tanacetum coccineum]